MKDGVSGHDHHDHPAGRARQEVCGRIGMSLVMIILLAELVWEKLDNENDNAEDENGDDYDPQDILSINRSFQ